MKIDDKDRLILEILKENGRVSNVEIAKKLSLTEGAIRHRIENMLKNGAIKKFTVELAPENEIFAVVMAKAKQETKKMASEIKSSGLAEEIYEISGDFDASLIISGASLADVDGKIDKIRELKSVADTKTFISLKRW